VGQVRPRPLVILASAGPITTIILTVLRAPVEAVVPVAGVATAAIGAVVPVMIGGRPGPRA
jgi:hypothetical protein